MIYIFLLLIIIISVLFIIYQSNEKTVVKYEYNNNNWSIEVYYKTDKNEAMITRTSKIYSSIIKDRKIKMDFKIVDSSNWTSSNTHAVLEKYEHGYMNKSISSVSSYFEPDKLKYVNVEIWINGIKIDNFSLSRKE